MTETYYARSDVRYQGGEKIFSIPFPYINKSHIKVFCNDTEISNYSYNNNYEITITADLVNGDMISIRRTTPITNRLVEFNDASILDKNVQNTDSKQVFYLVQEMYDKFGFTVAEDFEQLKQETVELQEQAQNVLEESANNVELAHAEAERAAAYAGEAEFGMKWKYFSNNNWVFNESTGYYEHTFDEPIINAVYKGSFSDKKLIENIDITTTSTGSIIKAREAFEGFALAANVVETYEHTQDIASDEWIIDHNTGQYPSVTIVDTNNVVVIGTIQYITLNRVKVTFAEPVAGKAYLR